jgi:S1-C subfamily serine protease
VSRDRAAADEMVRLTGQLGVPVTVIDGQTVIGFNRPRLEQLLASGGGQRPHLGLKVADASKMAQRTGGVPVFGALVGGVNPLSLGERAGLRNGDIITELNLRPIRGADDLERAMAELTTGSRATIVFLRGQETLRAEIVV